MTSSNVYLVSGGFDPIHSGHIDLLSVGSNIVVGLNSDEWLDTKRKGTPQACHFMSWDERKAVLEMFATVSRVVPFDDRDGNAVQFLQWARDNYGSTRKLVFVNGGDRKCKKDIPKEEREALESLDIWPRFLQGAKKNSSRDILSEYLRRAKKGA